jgi:hypothetical protein
MLAAILLLILPNLPWLKLRRWKRLDGEFE